MKCSYHNTLDAVSACADCGVGLCAPCTSEYSDPICSKCNRLRVDAEKAEVTKTLFYTVIAGFVGFFVAYKGMMTPGLPMSTQIPLLIFNTYLCAGIPFGWAALSRITPAVFLVMPLVGWVFYFVFKFFLAGLVGIVALPMAIVRIVRGKKRVAELGSLIDEVEERQLSAMESNAPGTENESTSTN